MLWGILMMRKQYGAKDFLTAFAVTGGCSLFLLTGDVKSKVLAGWRHHGVAACSPHNSKA
jgi:adenosine 3'-phospho 5'-phosphosulfate transporter B2